MECSSEECRRVEGKGRMGENKGLTMPAFERVRADLIYRRLAGAHGNGGIAEQGRGVPWCVAWLAKFESRNETRSEDDHLSRQPRLAPRATLLLPPYSKIKSENSTHSRRYHPAPPPWP